MEFLKADFTEVWVPSAFVPLIQFADEVRGLAGTGIDTFAIGLGTANTQLVERLNSFDEIVSWYGANRVEFRSALERVAGQCVFHPALPPLQSDFHAADFFARQVGAPLGQATQLRFDRGIARDRVVIHPFSGGKRKNWPLAKFEDLARSLSEPVAWLAGPDEELDGAVRIENLGTLARWLKGARVYIGNDSGITHLAAAVGVPSIALFGPTDPRVWAPRGPNVQVLRHQPIEDLPVETVLHLVPDRIKRRE